jgi:hypothetical protein
MADIDRIIADAEIGNDLKIGQRIHQCRVYAAKGGNAAHRAAHFVCNQRRIGTFDLYSLERPVDATDCVVVEVAGHQNGDRLAVRSFVCTLMVPVDWHHSSGSEFPATVAPNAADVYRAARWRGGSRLALAVRTVVSAGAIAASSRSSYW